ncbi:hypothetical protein Pst134EA_002447 [Puccinia striiformis f. sp. tritici]|uniref:hypothetical protein n=1 Tax=Puccinia striiformis f. sp. tritici TaxID=168172 RepID=UPI00200876A4|nr:hypothetical protein Pst134EA_002447 [Puccinia striiformis f. sp. tritici]KAH9464026.1 hypothetical protein Pst134EB_003565 [Puccinia striiformis f. sp. tritici]KAH9471809.1 hypothetical protein Pst134EA_002447 [Puccinia striiformis f. sp. tritici]
MATRPAPSAPPPYIQAVNRAYPKPLRPVVLFTTVVSLIWSLVLGVKFFQDRAEDSETRRMKVFDAILSVFFFVVAGLEVFGILAVLSSKILLARLYFFVSGLAAFLIFSAELTRLIAHFVVKNDLIDDCRSALTGAKAETLNGAIASIDATEASRLCEGDWQRGIWWDLGWLVLTSCLALLFTGLVGAYYHQLLDPSSSRSTAVNNEEMVDQRNNGRAQDGVNAYPMQPYQNMAYQSTEHQDVPFVPPQYNMPPEYQPAPGYVNAQGKHDNKEGLARVSLSDPPAR